MNLYVFSLNNPVDRFDPDGLAVGSLLQAGRYALAAGFAAIGVYEINAASECEEAQRQLVELARKRLPPEEFECWRRANLKSPCLELLADGVGHIGTGAGSFIAGGLLIRHGYNPLTRKPW